jgi:hypothetical protein
VGATYQAEGTHAFHEHFFQHAEPLSDLYHALYGEHGIVGRDNPSALRLYLLALDLIKEHGLWKHRRRRLQSNVPIGDQNAGGYHISTVDPVCNRWGANGFTPSYTLSSKGRPYFSSGFDYCRNAIGGLDWPAHSSSGAVSHLISHGLPGVRSGPMPNCGYKCSMSSSGTCSSRPHCGPTGFFFIGSKMHNRRNHWWLTGMCGPATWTNTGHSPSRTSSRKPECWPGVCGDCCNWKGCWDHDCGIISNGNLVGWTNPTYLDEFCKFGRKYCVKGYHRRSSSSDHCDKCPVGQYQEHAPFKGTTCTSCPNGKTTSLTAATSSSSCICDLTRCGSSCRCRTAWIGDGECDSTRGCNTTSCSYDGGDCITCSSGKYKSGSNCLWCRAGHYQSSSSHQSTSCSVCSSGQYASTRASTCTPCSAGRYQSAARQSSCIACSTGRYRSSTGATSSSACVACSSGQYYGGTGASTCTPCSAGRYQSAAGQSSCTACSTGRYRSVNAFDLATLTSPYTGTTVGRPSSKAVFGISLAPGARLTIGMTSNNFDSRHTTRWGGSCPGTTEVANTDDPDTLVHTWTNSQSSAEPVYFEIGPHGSSGPGTFVLEWSVTVGSAAASASASRPCPPCTFESSSLCGWTAAGQWTRRSGATPSSGTGPSGAQGGSYYMYLEASNGNSGASSDLTSPQGSYAGTSLSFYYHMNGSAINTLAVYAMLTGSSWQMQWSKVGQQHSSSSSSWTHHTIILPSGTTRVKFRGVRGSSYDGDIAIDTLEGSRLLPCLPCAAGKYSSGGSSSCLTNVCRCPHGTPTTGNGTTAGTLCQTHNSIDCAACNAGYHISGSVGQQQSCLPNVCMCPHGTPQSSAQCQTHGSLNCSACNAGYGFVPAISTACGSLNAFDLATLTSPYTGTTVGRPSSKAVFGISLAPGARLTIGMTSNSFDGRHTTRWGGSCPGSTQVADTDDPDTLAHTWTNSQSSAEPVYFEIGPISKFGPDGSGTYYSGTFVLEWSVTGGSVICLSATAAPPAPAPALAPAPAPAPAPPPPPAHPVTVSLSLDTTMAVVAQRSTFNADFAKDVSTKLNVPAARITVESVTSGSVIVIFSIAPAANGDGLAVSAILNAFVAAGVALPTLGLSTAAPIKAADIVVTGTLSLAPSPGLPLGTSDDGDGLPISIIAAVGGGVVVIIVGSLISITCWCKTKPANDINDEEAQISYGGQIHDTSVLVHQTMGHEQVVEGASIPNADSSPQTSTQMQQTRADKVAHERQQRLNKLEQQETEGVQGATTSANQQASAHQLRETNCVKPVELTNATEDVPIVPHRDCSRDAPSQPLPIGNSETQEVDPAEIQIRLKSRSRSSNEAELLAMPIKQLRSLAAAAGVSADQIDDAHDGHDPKVELVDLIITSELDTKSLANHEQLERPTESHRQLLAQRPDALPTQSKADARP